MFCDFCGKKLSNDSKYCRRCGRQQSDQMEDTQPIPIIDEVTFSRTNRQAFGSGSWHNLISQKKTSNDRSKVWRIMYSLVSLAMLAILIYILTTFKTIREYQILTGILGGLLVLYIWWKR
jgi:predicted amidophosphoribosyltransferase